MTVSGVDISNVKLPFNDWVFFSVSREFGTPTLNKKYFYMASVVSDPTRFPGNPLFALLDS